MEDVPSAKQALTHTHGSLSGKSVVSTYLRDGTLELRDKLLVQHGALATEP